MKEITDNIWDYYDKGHWIVITTNGSVRMDGYAVMGRGIANQAKQRYPELQGILGFLIRKSGNHVYNPVDAYGRTYKIFCFPVKHTWIEKADLCLIEQSTKELVSMAAHLTSVYMVRPGCGNGGLDWKEVKPVLEKYLDDRFVVVEIKR